MGVFCPWCLSYPGKKSAYDILSGRLDFNYGKMVASLNPAKPKTSQAQILSHMLAGENAQIG